MVTGAAGFIGSRLALHLAQRGHTVYACDWADDSGCTPLEPDPNSTASRLRAARMAAVRQASGVHWQRLDVAHPSALLDWMASVRPERVIHLAAQAGVRHSMQAPQDFVASNLVGFANVLLACHRHQVARLLYASSSSVYGMRSEAPFDETDRTDRPQSFYAATKQANEAMAFSFHAQYGLQSLGMRFFTVYGPWGRPDMAPYLFAQAIRRQKPVTLFAAGELMRDFTYVDDTVAAVTALALHEHRWQGAEVVNVGHQRPIRVIDFVQVLSDLLQTSPLIEHAPMQTADVALTCASESRLLHLVDAWPDTPLREGLGQFVQWLEGWDPLGHGHPSTQA